MMTELSLIKVETSPLKILQEKMIERCEGLKTKRKIEEEKKFLVDEYKVSQGCKCCGYRRHPSALCFNHLPDYKSEKHIATKNGGIKNGMNAGGMFRLYDHQYPIAVLIAEINKCEILCSNCHQEVTYPANKHYIKNISSGENL